MTILPSDIPKFEELFTVFAHHKYSEDIREGMHNYLYEMNDLDVDNIDDAFVEYANLKKQPKIPPRKEQFFDGMQNLEYLYADIAENIARTMQKEPIWREICVQNADKFVRELLAHGKTPITNEDSDLHGVGVSWSWEKDGAISYNNTEGDQCIRLASEVTGAKNVDTLLTIGVNLLAQKEETEIRLYPDQPLKLLQLCRARSNDYPEELCLTQKSFAQAHRITQGTFLEKDHTIIS